MDFCKTGISFALDKMSEKKGFGQRANGGAYVQG